MNLFLTDLRLPRAARAALSGNGPRAMMHVLPARLVAAAAVTGRLIGETEPDAVIVLSRLIDDERDRLAVVYRIEAAGDVWVPDVLAGHDGDAVRAATAAAVAAPAPGRQPAARDPGPHGAAARRAVLPPREEPGAPDALVAPAVGGAIAAAIALLGPGRVVGVLSGEASLDRLPEFGRTLGERTAAVVLRSRRTRDGGDHVLRSVSLAEDIADRLRLTVTQRARLMRVARSAAVRAGEIPAPLQVARATRTATKVEAKRTLAELEAALAGTARAEV